MDLKTTTSTAGTPGQIRLYLLSSLFAALMAAGAFIKIPLPYVPLTLQPLFVIMAGSVLGAKFGALSQLIYLAVGLSGVPVFANGGGPAYVLQPTFGYLLAYPVAAYAVGFLVGKHRGASPQPPSFLKYCAASSVGILIILFFGGTVLYFNFKFLLHKPITLSTLFMSYFLVFIPGDIIKIIVSSITSVKLQRVVPIYS
jgi:biotin transport system substrate-specific component